MYATLRGFRLLARQCLPYTKAKQAAGYLSLRRADRQFYSFLTEFAEAFVRYHPLSSMAGSHIGFDSLSGCKLGSAQILTRPWRRSLFATYPPSRALTTADGTRTNLNSVHVRDGGPFLCPPDFSHVTANYDPNQDSDPKTGIASWEAADDESLASLDLFAGLNVEQQAAVTEPPGPIRVVAGPGSGKTRVMTHRVAHLILNEGVKPYNILCITFTNKAAKELRERLKVLIGPSMTGAIWVGTFHAVGVRILRKWIRALPQCGRMPGFSICDSEDSQRIVKKVLLQVVGGVAAKKVQAKVVTALVMGAKGGTERGEVCGEAQMVLNHLWAKDGGKMVEGYERELRENNLVDFLDLVVLPVRVLDQIPRALQHYRARFRHLLVDEFQDTDAHQYGLVRRLALGENTHLFAVGDIDQSIYGWRGARPEFMHTLLDRDFEGIVTLKLNKNYRSSSNILGAAVDLISASEGDRGFGSDGALTLVAVKPPGAPIRASWSWCDKEEAGRVVAEITRLAKEEGAEWSDFAILYRSHAQSRAFELALVKDRVPFVVLGRTAFFSRKEVKDLLGYLRLVCNPLDSVSLKRVINTPPRGIGEKSVDALKDWAEELQTPLPTALLEFGSDLPKKEEGLKMTSRARTAVMQFCQMMAEFRQFVAQGKHAGEVLQHVIDEVGYLGYLKEAKEAKSAEESAERARRLEQLGEMKALAHQRGKQLGGGMDGLAAFLEDIALMAGPESEEEEEESVGAPHSNLVKLMTIHAAKGLEFNTVFLPGLEEGLLPSGKEEERSAEDTDEERRLCYVGMTRARERLYLSCAQNRWTPWGTKVAPLSKFLAEMLRYHGVDDQYLAENKGWVPLQPPRKLIN